MAEGQFPPSRAVAGSFDMRVIRKVVSARRVTRDRVTAPKAGREADLVGPDGFHPSVAGHEMVAAAFAAAYRSRLSTSSSAVAPRP